MEKVSREIAGWPQELGEGVADSCLKQVREYLNSPPDLLGNHLTAGRDIYITFLEQAGVMTSLDFSAAIKRFQAAMGLIPKIAEAIQHDDLKDTAAGFASVAGEEKEAYRILSNCVGES
jgi:hypothetical protein